MASAEAWGASWVLAAAETPLRQSLSVVPQLVHPDRSRRRYRRRRFLRAMVPLRGVSPPPAATSQSAFPIGRTWPVYAAEPRGCPSYDPLPGIPLFANLRTHGIRVNEEPQASVTA